MWPYPILHHLVTETVAASQRCDRELVYRVIRD